MSTRGKQGTLGPESEATDSQEEAGTLVLQS